MDLYEKNGNCLYILNILKKYSDENHKLAVTEIAKKVLEEISNDEHERELAELRQKYIMDQKAIQDFGIEKGLREGLEQGIRQGLKEGLEKGIKEVVITGIHVASYGKDFDNGTIEYMKTLSKCNIYSNPVSSCNIETKIAIGEFYRNERFYYASIEL